MRGIEKLTRKQVDELREAFILFDRDGDGNITAAEIAPVLRCVGRDATDAEVAAIMAEVDTDNNGTINFDEFVEWMAESVGSHYRREKLQDAFNIYDKDGNGQITRNELQQVMETLGVRLTDGEAAQSIKAADIDGDGQINFDEFVNMMQPQ